MKNVTLILMFVLSLGLIGCAGGSGGGGSPSSPTTSPHVPDNTPHDYTLKVIQLYAPDGNYNLTLHQICADGFPGFRDETVNANLTFNGTNTAIGCNAAENIVFEVHNPTAYSFAIIVSIDGVDQPDETVLPGQTFTFERGF